MARLSTSRYFRIKDQNKSWYRSYNKNSINKWFKLIKRLLELWELGANVKIHGKSWYRSPTCVVFLNQFPKIGYDQEFLQVQEPQQAVQRTKKKNDMISQYVKCCSRVVFRNINGYLAQHCKKLIGFTACRSHLVHHTTRSSNNMILHLINN